MTTSAPMAPKKLLIVGGGMVARRLVDAMRDRDSVGVWQITVLAEEPRAPYDRVALTTYFSGRSPEDLALGDQSVWEDHVVSLRRGVAARHVDRDARLVRGSDGHDYPYDALVLATGSYAAKPPVPGNDLHGAFVYRTIDDVAELRQFVEDLRTRNPRRAPRGVVVGGGLLGLEAAGALNALAVETTVVEFADRLMPLQVDTGGGAALHRLITGLGVSVRTSTATAKVLGERGRVAGMQFADGEQVRADVVVFATGVRPRDDLARSADLGVGERGGVLVDSRCRTNDPAVWAIGEVACIDGRCWGIVAPGYAMAEVVADNLLGGDSTFPGADTATKLKLLGVDVASFGDAMSTDPNCLEVVVSDPVAGVYKKLVLSDDARTLLGGIFVGDASAYAGLRPMLGRPLPSDPVGYLAPASSGSVADLDLPDDAPVCSCNNVCAGTVRAAVSERHCTDVAAVKACTKAGTSCGSCLPLVKSLVSKELAKAGIELSSALCEHFALSRSELFDAVRVTELRTFTQIIERHGTGGRGCAICRPVIASILASLYNEHILGADRGTLQDTNDFAMANLQKDGSYSVVPRIPGGEITPEGLIAIGEVAQRFGLYTKITGGQRIDLFGARIDQLPEIWRLLIDAGFESGHAYGKSLRTVKSCVGSTWCRFGVQDSVALAIGLELRYRGLRSPHKLKLGVSGCARECAEARGKDVGIIATEQGWNLYVGGNGGFTPRHAQLFAEDLETPDLIRTIDRFLMFYVRTADRLQRTAAWIEEYDGGLEALRSVVLDDSLGIGADLDAAMARHVDSYQDEWAAALDDPQTLARFTSFVNAPQAHDESLAYVAERGQARPARPDERTSAVLIAGTTLGVRP